MKCPFCGYKEDKVIDSRETAGGVQIRRRRECLKCGKRFTTYEIVEKKSLIVVKKDGRREKFNEEKILRGIQKACEKRPVSTEKIEEIVIEIEQELRQRFDREFSSKDIGKLVIKKLKEMDKIAYIRFASVYQEFRDLFEFQEEIKKVINSGNP